MDESLERAVAQAMREHRLDEWHRETVLGLVEAPPEVWPECCGNSCEPCVLVLSRVVRRVRQLLGAPPA